MKFRPLSILLCGTALASFLVGACVQRSASSDTSPPVVATALETSAQAQAPIRNADDLATLSSTYSQIARKVTPAVVNIQAQTVQRGRILRDPFSDFFGDQGGGRVFREPDRTMQSVGSGVIISADGVIITNNHVAGNATRLTVTLSDRRRYPAKLLGADAASDVAVLKIEGQNLPNLKWADSDKLSVGDIVLAVGSPFNLASTVTQGIISAKGRRDLGISAYEDFLQTDAAINPGNSGGALVDIYGNLIGINTAILSESGGNQGIGLAIPANLARSIETQLATTGRVTRGWLGVGVEPLTGDIADKLNLATLSGVLVMSVDTNSPAGRIPWNEQSVNIIQSLNGQTIDSPGQFRNFVANLAPGATVKMRVWQGGKTNEYTLKAGTRPGRAQTV